MPIYEFYCSDCHTVFSFFSATVDTAARPGCPRCGRPELPRKPSTFAAVRGGGGAGEGEEGGEGGPFAGMDEARMERAMASLAGEMEGLGENENPDPRQLAQFMRRFGEAAGMEPGPKLQEMLRQLDAGADPESLDDELGGGTDEDDDAAFSELFQTPGQKAGAKTSRRRPAVDETLYFL